ncbi:hypothetical protein ACFTY7_04085 [Streptomyces sp. NPDC057062]|nr:hypothetical protein [Streptomyces sp. MBT84]
MGVVVALAGGCSWWSGFTVEDGSVTSYEAIGDPVRLRWLSLAVLDA